MPQIFAYQCSACDFSLRSGWGGSLYVVNDDGERVACGHPGEHFTVALELGMSPDEARELLSASRAPKRWWWSATRKLAYEDATAIISSRTGFLTDMFCTSCAAELSLDLKRDLIECPACNSRNVVESSSLLGKPCPACKAGKLAAIDTGIMS